MTRVSLPLANTIGLRADIRRDACRSRASMRTHPLRRALAAACAAAVLVVTAMPASAQTLPRTQVEASSLSDVEFHITNDGIFGLDVEHARPGLIYPRSSGLAYMSGSGLWFGARKRDGDSIVPVVFVTFNINSGTGWATPGEYRDTTTPAPVYHSTEHSADRGIYTGTAGPNAKPTWPLWLPQGIDKSRYLFPGIFEPDTSQRLPSTLYATPAFVADADEEFTARFNDGDLTRYEVPVQQLPLPIRLQMQENVYAWSSGPLAGSVIVQYDVINRSSDTLFDCVAAQASDPEIGGGGNDHLRFYNERPSLRAAIAWSEAEAPKEYGSLAMAVIEAPVTRTDGFIDNTHRSDYREHGELGTCPQWTSKGDPKTTQERYAFLTTASFAGDAGADDQHALLASTRFNMAPGDTAHFAVAYMMLSTHGTTRSDSATAHALAPPAKNAELELLTALLLDRYYDHSPASAVAAADAAPMSIAVAPSPARASTRVSVSFTDEAPAAVALINTLGETVSLTAVESAIGNRVDITLDLGGLPPGLYFVRAATSRGSVAVPLVVVP